MNLPDFVALVAAMRSEQTRYFKGHSQEAQSESKRLERQVDRAIKEIQDPQPTLFGADR